MKGYFRKDDDGHNYFIPETEINKYDQLIGSIEETNSYSDRWYELIDEFCSKFDQYRCEPPSSYLIEINEDLLK